MRRQKNRWFFAYSVYLEKVLLHLYINGNDDSLLQGYAEILETLNFFSGMGFLPVWTSISCWGEIWDLAWVFGWVAQVSWGQCLDLLWERHWNQEWPGLKGCCWSSLSRHWWASKKVMFLSFIASHGLWWRVGSSQPFWLWFWPLSHP